MITQPELVRAFILVQGNRTVRQQLALDLTRFEGALGTSLRTGLQTTLWFEMKEGNERLPFEPWLSHLHAEGLHDIDLLAVEQDRSFTVLSLDLGPSGRRLYADRWERNAVALPSARALLDFVRRHPGEGLEERTAYYAREFGLVAKGHWAEVEHACAPDEDELWVQAFELAQSHVDVNEETATEWLALVERDARRKKSKPVLVFAPMPREEAETTGPASSPPVAEARAALEQALEDNLAIAQDRKWTTWIEWFTEALYRLHAAPAQGDPWVQVTSGCGVAPEVLALARAAQKSHVFGGMGSWNDVPCDNAAERERLWRAMHGAWGAVFAALKAYATAE
jgi:hypothetical protein